MSPVQAFHEQTREFHNAGSKQISKHSKPRELQLGARSQQLALQGTWGKAPWCPLIPPGLPCLDSQELPPFTRELSSPVGTVKDFMTLISPPIKHPEEVPIVLPFPLVGRSE